MNETLKSIIESYRDGLLSTPNIQVIQKKLYDETIEFPQLKHFFYFSSFKNSDLINMKFINVGFESSSFEKCIFENCIFENTWFRIAEFHDCMFKNCRFIDCDLSDIYATKTIFNECTFLKGCFNGATLELCHFLKPIFEDVHAGRIGSAVLIDSKFSNSKKSIEFEGEVYFNSIFDQIDKLHID